MMNELFFKFETGAATDVGCKREVNEDAYLTRAEFGLWVVADGMGGHAAGDFASQAIVEELNSVGHAVSEDDLIARVMARLSRANDRIQSRAAQIERGSIGATVVALLVSGPRYICIWAGDSRCYLLRGDQLVQQSRDHTEVQALIDAGSISQDEAASWPRKNVITRAVGVSAELNCDMVTGRLEPGDVFLLCSDGLTEHVSDPEISQSMGRGTMTQVCADLIDTTLQRGAKDNVTVIAISCQAADPAEGWLDADTLDDLA